MRVSMETRIARHVRTVQWYLEQGVSLEDAVAEVKAGSIFTDAIWEQIVATVKEGMAQ